jgi:hypothetical protein
MSTLQQLGLGGDLLALVTAVGAATLTLAAHAITFLKKRSFCYGSTRRINI